MNQHDDDSDTVAFWEELSGAQADELIFAQTPAWHQTLQDRVPRTILSLFITRIRRPSRIKTPLNLAPWTNRLLSAKHTPSPHRLMPLLETWLWLISHPETRYQTRAWHQNQRRHSRLRWRLQHLRATLRGHAPGAPACFHDTQDP